MKELTQDDISNGFRFFRIPTDLYNQWSEYAISHKQTMKDTLAYLLKTVNKQVLVPPYEIYNYPDIAEDWERTQPKLYKTHQIKQFHLQYTQTLQAEIFNICKLTGYKNQTVEIDKEICSRLKYALKINKNK